MHAIFCCKTPDASELLLIKIANKVIHSIIYHDAIRIYGECLPWMIIILVNY